MAQILTLKKYKPFFLSILLSTFCLPFSPVAQELKTPDNWRLVGTAEYSVLFWDIYEAKLFSPTGTFNQQPNRFPQSLLLELTYKMNIEGKELATETANQWKKMKFEDLGNPAFINELTNLFPDIKENDTLAIEQTRSGEAKLLFNQQLIHTFPASKQVNQFLAIWLGKNSTEPKLMQKLTGQR